MLNICKFATNLCINPSQVLNTVFWLGKAASGCASYTGPSLNLKEFEGLLAQMKVVSERSEGDRVGGRLDSGVYPSLLGCRRDARQKTNSFVFCVTTAFPISGRDKRGTECG